MDWSKIQDELLFRTSRSSGAGGQHVNKTETRVEVIFHPASSQGLSEREKQNLSHHLGHKLDSAGNLSVVDQSGRSQHTNRKRALARMQETIERGKRPLPKPRAKKPFVAGKRKRLERKKRRGELKAERSRKFF